MGGERGDEKRTGGRGVAAEKEKDTEPDNGKRVRRTARGTGRDGSGRP